MAKKRKLQDLLRRRKVNQVVEQIPTLPRAKAEELLKTSDNDVDKAIAQARDNAKKDVASPADTPKTAVSSTSDEDRQRDASEEPTTTAATTVDLNHDPVPTEVPKEDHDHSAPEQEPIEERAPELPQYDQLPRIPPPDEPLGPGLHVLDNIELERIIGAIQNGYSATDLRDYLSYHHKADEKLLKDILNEEVRGFPAIFYAVETNDEELIRYWIKYGGDPNVTHGPLRLPLLAFAILRGAPSRLQATKITETLLRLGASPLVIPAAFYDPFTRDLLAPGPAEGELLDIKDDNKLWYTPEIRPLLAAALNLTQRYRLWQASKLKPASGRERTLAFRKEAEEILGLQQTVIGQRLAAWSLRKSFIINLAMPGRKPLVFLFAGPKGHGKRELANGLGHLLSLDLEVVDCTKFKSEDELFGPNLPSQDGTPLNNFLARKTGQRSIVYMDEFEKTNQEIHNVLLLPFDQGEYTDRRTAEKVDCSQTIWVLATDKFDQIIYDFCTLNGEILSNSDLGPELLNLHKRLCRQLRKECIESFGAPLTSRITDVIPFLTFNEDEQAVLADKCIMELETKLASPVVKSANPDEDKPVGNVQMRLLDNAAVCSKIAKEYYLPEVGARSISGGVDATITHSVIGQYLEDGDDYNEDQAETKFQVGISEENEVEVSQASTGTSSAGYLGFKESW
ncbi:P-loop containing nucleoside triphosphate hydrolase protein [Hypoxylon crocopeplum]|nr:P-loop containing nucleoside triphosphate hydrolase protein [Hypoxylon crocopeplum]